MAPVSKVTEMPPRGRYLANEVGQLAGVSGQMIGQWARQGYIRSSVTSGRPRVYSFQDVAEAMVVHELLDRGVQYKDIRAHVTALRERFGTGWPLTHAPVGTAVVKAAVEGARPRVVTQEADDVYDTGRRGWQQQYVNAGDLELLADLLNRGGWAARKIPDLQHIEVNPDRLSGRPTIREHRIAAQDVAEMAIQPAGREILREDYELTDAEIDDALRWWRVVQEYEQAA